MAESGRYAAIDIGTVTCRLFVADIDDAGQMRELTKEYEVVNLGEGVDVSHHLKPEAIERTAATVARFLEEVAQLDKRDSTSTQVVTFATSASRDADNADEFASKLDELGASLRVIPGEREAALSFAGASSCFVGERVVVVDVGGGSTEVIAGIGGAKAAISHSFDIGCRRVTERFLKSDPPTKAEIGEARAWMREQFVPYFEKEISRLGCTCTARMVAVAGSATSVVSIRETMEVYDSNRVHLSRVTAGDLEEVFEKLSSMTEAERREVVGLDPKRAPVIVAGVLILQEVMAAGGFLEYTVSESDILQGAVRALANGF
ncbi:MAG: Ppx/GppA family phosphatase [Eggerthellaceae bacterium]|nr:Ppx/GppA family phosphatase [Eggerthellaceae bacterium]